jgi:hypothetical protein
MLLPLRASDRDRRHTIGVLKRGYLSGQMSTNTFEARVWAAEHARSTATLRSLIDDLRGRWLAAGVVLEALLPSRARPAARETAWATVLLSTTGRARLVLGRSSACDIVIRDRAVSRRHALLERAGARWYVSDLGSTNGTMVGGRPVVRAPLEPHDRIWVGGVRLDVR